MHTTIKILEDRTPIALNNINASALHQALKTAPTPVTDVDTNGRPFGDAKRRTSYNSGIKLFNEICQLKTWLVAKFNCSIAHTDRQTDYSTER